ncbi:4-oxalocrotonate tautomerase [Azospirillum sp. TSH100]|uniref:tautomerase family protein n=1 Tax=Azospirillum sp. TSH100 TaxID=652764 RepID=UPI000D61F279|nr:tautomerase family protein [Azospirillum sp. TSH100]PWC80328.1 4-oxalocrotonate tautomerase [Azospirillum sp. TSH100]QCG91920.1 4-oxalocrotonate tautomerase [Azospirillum sp. TSH100]
MPLIVFEAGQMKPEVKAELIRRLTEVSVQVTGIPKELFFVAVHELPDTDIAVGGDTVAEIKARLAV